MQYGASKGKCFDKKNIEMQHGQQMKQTEQSGYKYLGIIQDCETKIQILKDMNILEGSRKVKSELYAKNVFMGMNQWVLVMVKYNTEIAD